MYPPFSLRSTFPAVEGWSAVVDGILFHEPWWLSAASGGRYDEVTVKEGNDVVARLPFVVDRRMGFHVLNMPLFTHVLGPIVAARKGKYQTQLTRRLSIVRTLIDQLPPFDFFFQALDPSAADDLAIADGLAFQGRGFRVKPQYNFQIDCRSSLESIWDGMHFKTRQHIRRAEEKYTITTLNDPEHFVAFYFDSLKTRARKVRHSFEQFPALFSECRARNCGELLSALLPNGDPVAMTFLVWGNGILYYLLSMRSPSTEDDNGSVSLLIWSAIKKAHQLGLCFDFDGIATSGIARFYVGFGGQITTRLIVTRGNLAYIGYDATYNALRYVKRIVTNQRIDTSYFT
jgi:hypothetical protein